MMGIYSVFLRLLIENNMGVLSVDLFILPKISIDNFTIAKKNFFFIFLIHNIIFIFRWSKFSSIGSEKLTYVCDYALTSNLNPSVARALHF